MKYNGLSSVRPCWQKSNADGIDDNKKPPLCLGIREVFMCEMIYPIGYFQHAGWLYTAVAGHGTSGTGAAAAFAALLKAEEGGCRLARREHAAGSDRQTDAAAAGSAG